MTDATLSRAKRRTGVGTALLAFGMIGAAYASVPLYRIFCQTTGFGGTTSRAEAAEAMRALPSSLGFKPIVVRR